VWERDPGPYFDTHGTDAFHFTRSCWSGGARGLKSVSRIVCPIQQYTTGAEKRWYTYDEEECWTPTWRRAYAASKQLHATNARRISEMLRCAVAGCVSEKSSRLAGCYQSQRRRGNAVWSLNDTDAPRSGRRHYMAVDHSRRTRWTTRLYTKNSRLHQLTGYRCADRQHRSIASRSSSLQRTTPPASASPPLGARGQDGYQWWAHTPKYRFCPISVSMVIRRQIPGCVIEPLYATT